MEQQIFWLLKDMVFAFLLSLDYSDASSYIYSLSFSHTFITGQVFPLQNLTAIGSVSLLLIFSCQSFPCRKHHLLGFSPMNKQAIQSSPLNILISLASFSIGSALDELMVYVFSFVCVCFWTVNLC